MYCINASCTLYIVLHVLNERRGISIKFCDECLQRVFFFMVNDESDITKVTSFKKVKSASNHYFCDLIFS